MKSLNDMWIELTEHVEPFEKLSLNQQQIMQWFFYTGATAVTALMEEQNIDLTKIESLFNELDMYNRFNDRLIIEKLNRL